MSEAAQRAPTFFTLYDQGCVSPDAIDDFIDAWHETGEDEQRPLSEYLGMTAEEFGVWVITPRALPIILAARRANRPLRKFVEPYLQALKASNDPNDKPTLHTLSYWLYGHPPAD